MIKSNGSAFVRRLFSFSAMVSGLVIVAPLSADMVASWTFEENVGVGTQVEMGPISPEMGSGSFYGFGSESTVWSAGVGNGSLQSQSAQSFGLNSGYLIEFSTDGFLTPDATQLRISWHQTGTDTSPAFWEPQFSFDSENYFAVAPAYVITNDNWSSDPGFFRSQSVYTLDLMDLDGLDVPVFSFRLIVIDDVAINGGSVTADGISLIDNLTVSIVPEPSTYALFFGGICMAFVLIRARLRRRR